MRAAALLLLAALAALPAPPGPHFAAVSLWGTPSSPIIPYPGMLEAPLTIQIVYGGPATLYDVNVTLEPSWPLEPAPGQGPLSALLPQLSPGQQVELTGYFAVAPNATPGIYRQSVLISYVGPQGPGSSNLTVGVPVIGRADLVASAYWTEPPVVYAGSRAVAVHAVIVNYGDAPAVNASVALVAPEGAAVLGQSNYTFGAVPPGRELNLTFLLELPAPEGESPLAPGQPYPEPLNATPELVISYGGVRESVPVAVDELPAAHFAALQQGEASAAAGSTCQVSVELLNVGGAEAKFVTVSALPSDVLTVHVSTSTNPVEALYMFNESLGDVRPGGAGNVTFVVDVNPGAPAGTYYMGLLIAWLQPPTMQPMAQVVEVPVRVTAPFSILDGWAPEYVAAAVIAVLVVLAAVGAMRRRRAERR